MDGLPAGRTDSGGLRVKPRRVSTPNGATFFEPLYHHTRSHHLCHPTQLFLFILFTSEFRPLRRTLFLFLLTRPTYCRAYSFFSCLVLPAGRQDFAPQTTLK
jgi:hypothetical protein